MYNKKQIKSHAVANIRNPATICPLSLTTRCEYETKCLHALRAIIVLWLQTATL